MYFILFMKSTKMNDASESIWQTALKPVLISKCDSVTFAELVVVVCCFKQIKFHRRTFFRFRALKIYYGTQFYRISLFIFAFILVFTCFKDYGIFLSED